MLCLSEGFRCVVDQVEGSNFYGFFSRAYGQAFRAGKAEFDMAFLQFLFFQADDALKYFFNVEAGRLVVAEAGKAEQVFHQIVDPSG